VVAGQQGGDGHQPERLVGAAQLAYCCAACRARRGCPARRCARQRLRLSSHAAANSRRSRRSLRQRRQVSDHSWAARQVGQQTDAASCGSLSEGEANSGVLQVEDQVFDLGRDAPDVVLEALVDGLLEVGEHGGEFGGVLGVGVFEDAGRLFQEGLDRPDRVAQRGDRPSWRPRRGRAGRRPRPGPRGRPLRGGRRRRCGASGGTAPWRCRWSPGEPGR